MCVGVVSGLAADGLRDVRALLTGYEEVPTLSTTGNGSFRARINRDGTEIAWRLSYADTETEVTQAHIHFARPAINGAITVFLCTNLGNAPAAPASAVQACPAAPATITGTIRANDVLATPTGIDAGNLEELIAAIRARATYANVHTVGRGGGEIRGQLRDNSDGRGEGHDHD
jgi:hypothetical protein